MEKIKVGITHGDPNGVGYEVILKTFSDPTILELCTPIIYGSPKLAAFHRKALDLNVPCVTLNDARSATDGKVNLVDCLQGQEVKVEYGQATEEAGLAALCALEKAMQDYQDGLFDVLVTAPINKHAIQSEKFRFPGHTEYIEEKVGNGQEALMILMQNELRVALATTHIPIKDIAQTITKELIVKKVTILHEALKRDFFCSAPRIAV
ncbi:MAG: 4-hydroxythreonine-4-phosphate dehydrogenase PdxA, partial [Bacteroidaceae bacterium]|nr:4-hydroxythreonine-4-phosphate dehydrogenase PdxA [Bacteroidaceae bacterium]